MKQKIIALLLIVHGLISSIFMFYIENPPDPSVGWNGTSWILSPVLDGTIVYWIGLVLWALTMILFVFAGIAVLKKMKQWRMIDILASIVSLLAYVLFWFGLEPEPTYWVVGPAVAIITFVALVIVRWPTDEWIFGASLS